MDHDPIMDTDHDVDEGLGVDPDPVREVALALVLDIDRIHVIETETIDRVVGVEAEVEVGLDQGVEADRNQEEDPILVHLPLEGMRVRRCLVHTLDSVIDRVKEEREEM